MSTYQKHLDDGLAITTFKSDKFLRILLTALFVTAAFIVPTTGAIKFLFF
jgi:hypothetical protein